jgi:hypothetical protein
VPISWFFSAFLQDMLHFLVSMQQLLQSFWVCASRFEENASPRMVPGLNRSLANQRSWPLSGPIGNRGVKKTATQSQCRFRKDGTNFGTPLFR